MVNYQNGKIYKLVCNTTGLVYFGSTCEITLARRLAGHKKMTKQGKPITSSQIIENDNYGIFLVETYPCNTKDELNMRERFYIENNVCINKQIPIRTEEEKPRLKAEIGKRYRNEHKTELAEKSKQYQANHKIEIAEYLKKYNEINNVKLIERKKQYYEKNKDKWTEYSKQYVEQEGVKEKMREAVKRCRYKIKVKKYFLNFLQCFNV